MYGPLSRTEPKNIADLPKDSSAFAGITTYGLLPHLPCLKEESVAFDIAIVGIPFDSGVTYRPGARFGPSAIRQASRHLTLAPQHVNPLKFWGQALDCGDIQASPHDKEIAMKDIEKGYTSLLRRPAYTKSTAAGAPSDAAQITHGSFFYWANQEGLISNSSNMHAGLRTTLSGLGDYDEDELCGFARIEAREIDDIGTRGIIKKILERVGT
ncbi:Agmatinase [Colletotrichum sp. SAR11_239]|nr:Agmatinase [Colletotrichum sp. SAR11_239]